MCSTIKDVEWSFKITNIAQTIDSLLCSGWYLYTLFNFEIRHAVTFDRLRTSDE